MRKEINSLHQLIRLTDEQLQQMLQSNLQELHLTSQQIKTLKQQKQEWGQALELDNEAENEGE